MKRTFNWLTMDDQFEIYVRKWISEGQEPRAILQLSHGMAEHIERYDAFARFLVERGIFVFGNDHRGHGYTGERANIHGFFKEENGFERVVDDLYNVHSTIKKDYPNIPVFLMGHSMGSFLARRFIQKYPHSTHGVIISGTGGNPGIAGKLGKFVAKREIRKRGIKEPSPTLNRLSFGSFNKGVKNPNTEYDWLSRDPNEVEKYINDPFCGFVCSAGFYYDLFSGLEKIHDNQLITQIRKDLPMFIFSGDKDPVGKNTKGVQSVVNQYKKHGIKNIQSIFFKEGRHEMLNETNKEEVYHAVYDWMDEQIKSNNSQIN